MFGETERKILLPLRMQHLKIAVFTAQLFVIENDFKNYVCKMAFILYWLQYVDIYY